MFWGRFTRIFDQYSNLMSNKETNLKEKLRQALTSTIKVISDNLEVACGNNQSIKIIEIQRQGKNPQKIGEFKLGTMIKKGFVISYV